MPATCFKCGQSGHIAPDCKWTSELASDGKPAWCGTCDRRTRLVLIITSDGEKAMRCTCHPLSSQLPRQFTRCPGCRTAIYAWDTADCDGHQAIGVRLSYRPAPDARPHEDDRITAALQAAESRAIRGPILDDLPDHTVT